MTTELVQPFVYRYREPVEPDWRRLPVWRNVAEREWHSARWQRAHCVKNVRELREVFGPAVSDTFFADLDRDQRHRATMSLLVTPHLLNTMAADATGDLTAALYQDPVRRYMLPVDSDRLTEFASHPYAERDSLHERDMWVVEGLTHRYPTKVLAELVPTCPQYCGHCTRMDLVGRSTAAVEKVRFRATPAARYEAILDYLRAHPGVRDVVVSGGDVANVPWHRLEAFVSALFEIDSIRDVRLASKALIGLPQHWASDEVVAGVERLATRARSGGVQLALHTHANAAQQITPAVRRATDRLLAAGLRDVRNQAVLLHGVNDTPAELLELCFALLDGAAIMPYYVYLADMIPASEHWRTSVAHARDLQRAIMGYLPGFATPRIVCDVPFAGKRWVDQVDDYDRVRGISYWSKNYNTGYDDRPYRYYDPIHTLPHEGRLWWHRTAAR